MPSKRTAQLCACGCGAMTKAGPTLRGHQLRIRHHAVAKPIDERYWPKVRVSHAVADCWLWAAGCFPSGYGEIGSGPPRNTMLYAHHVAWWLATGRWPVKGEFVCHDCPGGDNRACVRNDTVGVYNLDGVSYEKRGHLWLGDQAANNRDMWLKGRSNWQTVGQPEKRGERNVNAALTAEVVREMRRMYASGGATYAEIGALFGVHVATAHRAIVGKTWKHL